MSGGKHGPGVISTALRAQETFQKCCSDLLGWFTYLTFSSPLWASCIYGRAPVLQAVTSVWLYLSAVTNHPGAKGFQRALSGSVGVT